jgi:1-acyl-sn-glycerol-3-phosphate acyltransferase
MAWFFLVVLPIIGGTYLTAAAAHLYAVIAWTWLRRQPHATLERRVGVWMLFWSDTLFTWFCAMMRIKLRMRLPIRRASLRPTIVIANHRSTIETLMLPLVLRRLGYRCAMRGIAKRSFKNYPLVGHAVRALMWAFLERGKGKDESLEERRARQGRDLHRVEVCSRGARDVGACMMIFPEGRLFSEPIEGSGLEHMLPPKTGGISVICRELPQHDVLSILLHLGSDLTDFELHQAGELFGRTITIAADYIPRPASLDDVEPWIMTEWRRIDRLYGELEQPLT